MSNLAIEIGQGENKTIRFKLKTELFESTDVLLFAIKDDVTGKNYVYTYQKSVSELTSTTDEEENTIYTFSVILSTETTRKLNLRNYYYDLTLIDTYGQEKPLVSPQIFTVKGTIGASLSKAGA